MIGPQLDMGLEVDGQVGVVRVMLEVILLKHGIVQAAGEAAGFDVFYLIVWSGTNMASLYQPAQLCTSYIPPA